MGVSNVNNLNKIDLTKLALAQKSRQAKSNQPAYMQMTGSIFNAPEVKQQQETTNLNTLNTKKSLSELTKKTSTSNSTTNKTEGKDKEENVDQGSVKSQVRTTILVHTLAGAMYGLTGFIESSRIV